MRRHLLVTALASCVIAMASVAFAQAKGSADVLRATVTIDAIDQAQRMVTVTDESGNKNTLHAPPEMKRFDELKVGDKINLTYYMATAFEVRKRDSSEPQPVGTSGTTITRGDGDLPSAAATQRMTATVTVIATDLNNALLTVRTPTGRVIKHKVQDPSMMKGIVADDKIDITYAEGLLIEVERP